MKRYAMACLFLFVFVWPVQAAVNGELLARQVNKAGYGYVIATVFGSDYEMGYAHGYLLATDVDKNARWVRQVLGARYGRTLTALATTYWPLDVQQEIQGLVAGVKAKMPRSIVTTGDIKLLNTFADWGYAAGCRSHAAWGSYMPPGVEMLATRRTDRSTPSGMAVVHLILAYRHANGFRWVNVGLPGLVIAATAVRQDGTMVAIHDAPESGGARAQTNVITRSMATRVLVRADDVHAGFAALQPYKPWTGTFLNVFGPNRTGGVIAADATRGFYNLRLPQPSYFGGEVIHTSNLHTDGTSAPVDFPEVAAYYGGATPKTLADHFGLLNHITTDDGFQLLSVAYRGPGDMTLWYQGRLAGTSTTPVLSLEWSALFRE